VRSGRGKHTTRNVSLLPLPTGGYLTDTPGFNQPSLTKVTKNSLAWMFPEVRCALTFIILIHYDLFSETYSIL
jgi:ribosome biogenesis GTPase